MSDFRLIKAADLEVDLSLEPVYQTPSSKIFGGTCHATPVYVEISSRSLEWTEDSLQAFRQELERRINLSHPNLCLILGACIQPQVAVGK